MYFPYLIADPQLFTVTGIQLLFFPSIEPRAQHGLVTAPLSEDMFEVLRTGELRLSVGSCVYHQVSPLGTLQRTLPYTKNSYFQFQSVEHEISPLLIKHKEHFKVTLNFDDPVPLHSGTDGRICVWLNGWLQRPIC